MAISLNRVQVMGYLGAAPEMTFHDGFSVVHLSVGVSESFVNKHNGQRESRTEWVRCSIVRSRQQGGAADALSEWCARTLRSGDPVYVEGSLRMRTVKKDDGSTSSYAEVRVDTVQALFRVSDR